MENNPLPTIDKMLNEILISITEVTSAQPKEKIKTYNLEMPKIFGFLNTFKKFYIINKNEINKKNKDIENEITNSITKFEDRRKRYYYWGFNKYIYSRRKK